VYIGGGAGQTNAGVSFDLSGTANVVDSVGLGFSAATTIDTGLVGNVSAKRHRQLSAPPTLPTHYLTGGAGKQTFDVTVAGKRWLTWM